MVVVPLDSQAVSLPPLESGPIPKTRMGPRIDGSVNVVIPEKVLEARTKKGASNLLSTKSSRGNIDRARKARKRKVLATEVIAKGQNLELTAPKTSELPTRCRRRRL